MTNLPQAQAPDADIPALIALAMPVPILIQFVSVYHAQHVCDIVLCGDVRNEENVRSFLLLRIHGDENAANEEVEVNALFRLKRWPGSVLLLETSLRSEEELLKDETA